MTFDIYKQGRLSWCTAYTIALGLPRSITGREDLVTVTFAVVGFYVFVPTLVMIPLLHRVGVIRPGDWGLARKPLGRVRCPDRR